MYFSHFKSVQKTSCLLMCLLLLSKNALAAPTAFAACEQPFFLSQGTPTDIDIYRSQLTSSGSVDFNKFNVAARIGYNALAYHEPSNFLYALLSFAPDGTSNAHLIQIGDNGEYLDLGEIKPGGGNELSDNFYLIGDMDPSGNYYVMSSTNRSQISKIEFTNGPTDVVNVVISKINLDKSVKSGDMAWSGGFLWALHEPTPGADLQLIKIDPSQGPSNTVTVIGDIGNNYAYGAMWGTPDSVYANANGGQGFFHINTSTGVATKIADSLGAGRNDAARCNSNRPIFDADLSITKDNGQTVYSSGQTINYKIVVANAGPFGVGSAEVSDPLPTGITTANWTCGNSTGGGQCNQASGTGAINATVNLPKNSSVEFNLSFTLDPSFIGDLVNVASVKSPSLGGGAPKQARDTDTGNNEATDKDRSLTSATGDTHGVPTIPYPLLLLIAASMVLTGRRYLNIRR